MDIWLHKWSLTGKKKCNLFCSGEIWKVAYSSGVLESISLSIAFQVSWKFIAQSDDFV